MPSTKPQMRDSEDPENDWHYHPSIPGTVLIYCFITCIIMSYFIITSSGNHVSPLEGIQIYRHVILSTFTGLYGVILFSLFIEPVVSEKKHWLRFSLQFVNMSFFGSSTIVGFYFFIWDQCIAAGLYILCACACRVLG